MIDAAATEYALKAIQCQHGLGMQIDMLGIVDFGNGSAIIYGVTGEFSGESFPFWMNYRDDSTVFLYEPHEDVGPAAAEALRIVGIIANGGEMPTPVKKRS